MEDAVDLFVGFDPREVDGFVVALNSAVRLDSEDVILNASALELSDLRERGMYRRPTSRRDGRLWDDISDAPMATEFACSRFLVPHLSAMRWALFVDSDVLFRANVSELLEEAQLLPGRAVYVVQHDHQPTSSEKMDGQIQTSYRRKNWSSVMLFDMEHSANDRLTIKMVNSVPGRDLHALCWLEDDEVGALSSRWNHLVGHTSSEDPAIVHFTDGLPSMSGYEDCEFADEWREELRRWARS